MKKEMYENVVVQDDMKDLVARNEIPKESFRNKKILVTGANGMLATYLIYFFMFLNAKEDANIDIYALTRNRQKAEKRFGAFLENRKFHLVIGDVCSEINVDENVDYIIHSAGNASPHFIIHDPIGIIKANTIGTVNILDFAKKHRCARVLYTSTREIYGEESADIQEITEEQYGCIDPTHIRSCYPESKRLAETLLESYRFQYSIDYVTVRIAHSYGPGMNIENDGRVMSDFIFDTVSGHNIILKSTGNAERAFCYLTDAIAGILIAMANGKSGNAYNLANEAEPMLIRDVAEMLVNLFPEKGIRVEYQIPRETSIGYSKVKRTKLNTDKLRKLGWKCRVSLSEGLRRTVLSFNS